MNQKIQDQMKISNPFDFKHIKFISVRLPQRGADLRKDRRLDLSVVSQQVPLNKTPYMVLVVALYAIVYALWAWCDPSHSHSLSTTGPERL